MVTDYIKSQLIEINRQIRMYRKALADAVASGVQSASVSSGGASQSYTRYSLNDLRQMIAALEIQKAQLLNGGRRRRTSPDFQ